MIQKKKLDQLMAEFKEHQERGSYEQQRAEWWSGRINICLDDDVSLSILRKYLKYTFTESVLFYQCHKPYPSSNG